MRAFVAGQQEKDYVSSFFAHLRKWMLNCVSDRKGRTHVLKILFLSELNCLDV